jgi:ABC-2 type transport system permease protein
VYLALYRSTGTGNESVGGFDASDTMTWAWINQSLLMTVYLWGWWEVVRAIQTGAIAMELLKPYDYFSFWMARDLGRALAHFLMRGVPTFVVGVLLFDVRMPLSASHGVAFIASMVLAVMVSFCLRFISNVIGFWVLDYRGVAMLYAATINIFSGMLIPLALMPNGLEAVASLLPFRAVIMVPTEVYLGQRPILEGLLLQAGWLVALSIGAQYLLHAGERKLVVQGG